MRDEREVDVSSREHAKLQQAADDASGRKILLCDVDGRVAVQSEQSSLILLDVYQKTLGSDVPGLHLVGRRTPSIADDLHDRRFAREILRA